MIFLLYCFQETPLEVCDMSCFYFVLSSLLLNAQVSRSWAAQVNLEVALQLREAVLSASCNLCYQFSILAQSSTELVEN